MAFPGHIGKAILFACFLLLGFGCSSYDSKMYQGKVTDEHGNPVQGVTVKLCYLGWKWDWNMQGGFPLTMGHPFCSVPVVTDRFGNYKVVFSGPHSTYVLARHKEWVQVRDTLASSNRVEMMRATDYRAMEIQNEAKKEEEFRRRRAGESDEEYYCRVVRKRSVRIEFIYKGNRINIFQTLLARERPMFAVSAPYKLVKELADDVTIKEDIMIGNKTLISEFHALPGNATCKNNIFFVQANADSYPPALISPGRVNVRIESAHVGFNMNVWKDE